MPTHSQRLIHAVRTRTYDRLRELITLHGGVSARSRAGRTALHAAAEEGDLESVRILVAAKSDVNARMQFGQTPLHLAAGYGGACDLGDLDPDRADPCNRNRHKPVSQVVADVLTQILKEKNPELPSDLTAQGAIPPEDKADVYLAVLECVGEPAKLHQEIVARGIDLDRLDPDFSEFLQGQPRFLKVVKFLLKHGAEIEARDDSGNSPLHSAVERGQPEMVELLLESGANPNPVSAADSTDSPVNLALEYCKTGIADVLLRHGAKFDPRNSFCLHEAAGNGRQEIVSWLLRQGAEINQPNEDGDTALMDAARNGHHEVVTSLIERGADVQVHNAKGDGLLHAAAWWLPCLIPVLPLGLPVNETNAEGTTPLHVAASSGDARAVEALVKAGASLNVQNHDGNTPLHLAFSEEELRPDVEFPIFQALVVAGIDRSIRNAEGKTAHDLAVGHRYPREYLQLLEVAAPVIWLGAAEYLDFLPRAMIGFKMDGENWPSCEHYFHGQRVDDVQARERIRQARSTTEALHRLREADKKPRGHVWSRPFCDTVMRAALSAKFRQNHELGERLLATGDVLLVSDSNCDSYWQEKPGAEFNEIGKMLMSIRAELRVERRETI